MYWLFLNLCIHWLVPRIIHVCWRFQTIENVESRKWKFHVIPPPKITIIWFLVLCHALKIFAPHPPPWSKNNNAYSRKFQDYSEGKKKNHIVVLPFRGEHYWKVCLVTSVYFSVLRNCTYTVSKFLNKRCQTIKLYILLF